MSVLPYLKDNVMTHSGTATICQYQKATMRDLVKMASADVQIVTTMTTAPAYVRTCHHKAQLLVSFLDEYGHK